jgi:hypothetical protein
MLGWSWGRGAPVAGSSSGPYDGQMLPRAIRSITAAGLVLLLGVLHTGLPSHSHERSGRAATLQQLIVDADHHAHGTLLVEQMDRVQSTPVQLAAQIVSLADAAFSPPAPSLTEEHGTALRPSERGPPPAAPRAPPQPL